MPVKSDNHIICQMSGRPNSVANTCVEKVFAPIAGKLPNAGNITPTSPANTGIQSKSSKHQRATSVM